MAERRRRGGRDRVFGLHPVRALLERKPESIVAASVLESADHGALALLAAELEHHGIPVARLRRGALDALADGGRHQGIVVEIQSDKEFTLGDFEDLVARRGLALRLLVLDSVEDPRNLGACLRTADATGVDAVVVPRSRTVELTAAARKAASGAAETVPLLRAANLARTLGWLKAAGVWIVGAAGEAGTTLYAARLAPPVAIVLGAEGRGLRRLTREACDELVAIPMAGSVGSLNVSVAAGVVLYELVRRSAGA